MVIEATRIGTQDSQTEKSVLGNETIAVVGLGYVGMPLAEKVAKSGYPLIGIDIDEGKVQELRSNAPHLNREPSDNNWAKTPVTASSDFDLITEVSTVIICVPTPVDENKWPDLSIVEAACTSVASRLQRGQLVILESTVNPGVTESVVIPALENGSGLIAGQDFQVAHCPERINPGDTKWDVSNIPRVVGSLSESGLRRAVDFYESVIEAEIRPMGTLKEAEAVKIVENAFRDINIAFVNELALSFSRLGIDVVKVIEGASTKPFAFMPHMPGCGVGGHCIPVDPYYLIHYAKANGFDHDFLSLARRINERMPEFTANLVSEGLNEIGKAASQGTVALLGMTYKPDVADDRESPSHIIQDCLMQMGMRVITFDPHSPEHSSAASVEEALDHADVALIATAHASFAGLRSADFVNKGVRVVVDGRNCLPKDELLEAGLIYKGIGR